MSTIIKLLLQSFVSTIIIPEIQSFEAMLQLVCKFDINFNKLDNKYANMLKYGILITQTTCHNESMINRRGKNLLLLMYVTDDEQIEYFSILSLLFCYIKI